MLPAPAEVSLDDFYTAKDNRFRLWLCLQDDARIVLDFVPGSRGHQEILQTATALATERLRRLGREEIEIAGLWDGPDDSGAKHR